MADMMTVDEMMRQLAAQPGGSEALQKAVSGQASAGGGIDYSQEVDYTREYHVRTVAATPWKSGQGVTIRFEIVNDPEFTGRQASYLLGLKPRDERDVRKITDAIRWFKVQASQDAAADAFAKAAASCEELFVAPMKRGSEREGGGFFTDVRWLNTYRKELKSVTPDKRSMEAVEADIEIPTDPFPSYEAASFTDMSFTDEPFTTSAEQFGGFEVPAGLQ